MKNPNAAEIFLKNAHYIIQLCNVEIYIEDQENNLTYILTKLD